MVVVVLLVVGVLFWLGAFSSGAAKGISSNPPYSSAIAAGSSTAHGAPGGPWAVVLGVGIALASNVTEPAANISSDFDVLGCTFAWVGPAPASVTFPWTPGSATAGNAGAWVFVSTNSSLDTLVTLVANTTSTNLFTLSGSCGTEFAAFSALPGGVVDSTTAAISANNAGGAEFLASHTGAERVYAIASASMASFTITVWEVAYSTCPLFANANTTGYEFNVTEDATTGAPIIPGSTGTVSCASTLPAPF